MTTDKTVEKLERRAGLKREEFLLVIAGLQHERQPTEAEVDAECERIRSAGQTPMCLVWLGDKWQD